MFKNLTLSLICAVAPLLIGPAQALAQYAPEPVSQEQPAQTTPAPDDLRLVLMIRNAVIALNQANLTGNYSVLRDMGTPNFQMTNSSARLAEAFSTLRARKVDISPVMFFNPKLLSPPAVQEGQVLRLTGFFPTTPEQVHFDIAFQLYGEQWMLAAIAVNVAPPGEASAAPVPGRTAETEANTNRSPEAKPIRIDLSQPASAPSQPAAPKKAVTKKTAKPHAQQTAAAQPASPAPAPSAEPPAKPQEQAATAQQKPAGGDNSGFGAGWNPFGR